MSERPHRLSNAEPRTQPGTDPTETLPDADRETVGHVTGHDYWAGVLEYVSEAGSVHRDRLVELVANRTGDDEARVQQLLHHVHLPILEDAEAVAVDAAAAEVHATETTATFAAIARYVGERLAEGDDE